MMRRALGLATFVLALSVPLPATGTASRVWDGLDPFRAPAATTDFYGSGDVNLDGQVTPADVNLAKAMVRGDRAPSYRADVDFDGDVDMQDVELLRQAVGGRPLPARWDLLVRRADREAQLGRILARDRTNEHPASYWFDAPLQHFVRAVFYHGEMLATPLDGGPTLFNVPMYVVIVITPSGDTLELNAVLVGDHPLVLTDWLVFDPLTEGRVEVGDARMPFGAHVWIEAPVGLSVGEVMLRFNISSTGSASIFTVEPGFVQVRPAGPLPAPDNQTDLGDPRLVPGSPPLVAFERVRDDLAHAVDVHLADFPVQGLRPGVPLTGSAERTRLLDVSRSPDGTLHLLFAAERGFEPGVFYARLDPSTRRIVHLQRIAPGIRMASQGRLVATATGELHAFWLEIDDSTLQPYQAGIYWSVRRTGGVWTPAVHLAPEGEEAQRMWLYNISDSVVDVTPFGGSGLAMVWVEPYPDEDANDVRYFLAMRLYRDGHWEERTILDQGVSSAVHLVTGPDGVLHLFDWAPQESFLHLTGPLQHRSSVDAVAWTDPESLDDSGVAAVASVAAGPDGRLDLVWDRRDGGQVIWRRFRAGHWSRPRTIAQGAEKPTATALPDGSVVFLWSIPRSSSTGIGSMQVTAPP